jgi:predicted dehydrogenase
MSKASDGGNASNLPRRDFLAVGALPFVAGLGIDPSGDLEEPIKRSPQEVIRVGLIGAGANVRSVMIPGLRRITGCEIVAVANRSLESSRRVADEFEIPRAYGSWSDLIDDDDLDAVLIGTWPYMHHTLTLAALDAGKHVLCQARMANTAREARDMLDASRRHPEQVCQLVPTSQSYRIDNAVKQLIREGYVGEVLSVEAQRLLSRFADYDGELDWRHDAEYSGFNAMTIGASYESVMRWLGPGRRVMAMAQIHVPYRRGAGGEPSAVEIPDHLDIVYQIANGAQVHMRASETTGFSTGNQTWIYGSEGTIHIDRGQRIFAGRRGDSELTEVPNPREGQAYYRVEEEFISAIRGEEGVTMTTFETGVRYMEWTEAVHRSAQAGEVVGLPL